MSEIFLEPSEDTNNVCVVIEGDDVLIDFDGERAKVLSQLDNALRGLSGDVKMTVETTIEFIELLFPELRGKFHIEQRVRGMNFDILTHGENSPKAKS